VVTPIPVSNPTVGTGLQAVAMYLHEPRTAEADAPTPMSGLGAMYTDEQSWFAGAFHQDYLLNDTMRLLLVGGAGAVDLEYYGVGPDSEFADNPADYTLRSQIALVDTQYRLPWTDHWYLGPSYRFSNGQVDFDVPDAAGLPDAATFQNAALGLALTYDSRSDTFYPTSGTYAELEWLDSGAVWGGDFDYGRGAASINRYLGLTERLTLALRGDLQGVSAGAPFFGLASPDVRGYSRLRYANDYALSVHAEGRYKVLPRWGFVVFVDTGWVGDSVDGLLEQETVSSFGGGIRWQPVADKGLNLGLDIAFTDEDSVVFIQIGERF
jgi:outer membrane protein assembly factor BamA